MKAFELGGGIPMWMTFSDFQAWFFVYSASTRSGSSLDSRTNGSRSGLVLAQQHREELDKASQKLQGLTLIKKPLGNRIQKKGMLTSLFWAVHNWVFIRLNTTNLEPLKNPLVSFFFQGHWSADLPHHIWKWYNYICHELLLHLTAWFSQLIDQI